MKKILAIGASNSSDSINKKLATYTANQFNDSEIIVADLTELVLPLYSTDLEKEAGIPENAQKFFDLITSADAIVLSLAEHNGLMTAAFKNLWDWASRIDMKLWQEKPMLLMATSPGGRGGLNALNSTKSIIPHFGGNVVAEFSLPLFHENFSESGIKDEELNKDLNDKINVLQQSIDQK